jgi:hypothetical protein
MSAMSAMPRGGDAERRIVCVAVTRLAADAELRPAIQACHRESRNLCSINTA